MEFNVNSNIDGVEVEVLSSGDLKARIIEYDQKTNTGSIEVYVADQVSCFSKIVLIANNGRRIAMKRLEFSDEGIGVFNNTEKQIDSDGGIMDLEFVSSVETEILIPEDARSWIEVVPASRSAEYNCVSIKLKPNTGSGRSAYITVQSVDGQLSIVFYIHQNANYGFIEPTEYEALRKVLDAYCGDAYTEWQNTLPEYWPGVVFDNDGHVIELNLNHYQWAKSLPSEIGVLTHLTKLIMDNYYFETLPDELALCKQLEVFKTLNGYGIPGSLIGELPSCLYELPNLRELSIRHHHLSEIDSRLANLPKLEIIQLSGNSLKNFDFDSLLKLKNLTYFDCSINYDLKGSLPTNIGDLKNLEYFNIGYCSISGDLPESFWTLPNLTEFSIARNKLNAIRFPSSISKMKSLVLLAMSEITILGGLPDDIGLLPNIESIVLESCHLTGTIPLSISKAKKLRNLTLFQNQLRGEIPADIANLNIESLNLAKNLLTGTIPQGMGKFKDLCLYDNNLSGNIPEDLINSDIWRNGWGKIYCGNNLNYDFNPFPGPNNLEMSEDTAYLIPYDFSTEYSKHKYTILFQFTDDCPYFAEALKMMKEIRNTYSPDDVYIVGRTFSECAKAITANNMTWPVYFSQQLDYPYYVTPTITVFDSKGYVIFTDVIQDRFTLPKFIEGLLTK